MHTYCLLTNGKIVVLFASTENFVTVYPLDRPSEKTMVPQSHIAVTDSNLSYLKSKNN